MSGQAGPEQAPEPEAGRETGTEPAPEPAKGRGAERIVFDDPLGRQTSDDTDEGWGERRARSADDSLEWYLREKPPHHG